MSFDSNVAVFVVAFIVVLVIVVNNVEVEATVVIAVIIVEGVPLPVVITGCVLPSVVFCEPGLSEEDAV